MPLRKFRAYATPSGWFLYCPNCDTREWIGPTPARAHDHAATHARWWHTVRYVPA